MRFARYEDERRRQDLEEADRIDLARQLSLSLSDSKPQRLQGCIAVVTVLVFALGIAAWLAFLAFAATSLQR